MHEGLFIELGMRENWGGQSAFGLLPHDRLQHTWICGKSGTGKSTLLKALLIQAIEAGEGLALIEPHGDLATSLLEFIPPWRTDDVVYFDPADLDYPIGINPLANVPDDARHLVVNGIVGAFRSLWGSSWGPRLEYVLANTLAALCECQNVTLLGVPRMLTDGRYRDWIVKQVKDPIVRQFWTREFASWDERFRAEAISPIQNKVGQLLMAAPLRNILGQVKAKIDFRFMMDDRRILIANLSKGKLGADNANLLGSLLVTQFQLAAMSRADVPPEERHDFLLVIDEFHNFTTNSFREILSESRKYALGLVIANQFLGQQSEAVREAVLGNVGTILSFRVGEADAAVLAREFGGGMVASQFTDLANFEVCARVLESGVQREPFVGKTRQMTRTGNGRAYNVRRRSREKHAATRAVVEDKIRRWLR